MIFLPSDVQSIPFFPLFYIIVSFYWDTCNFMFYLDCNIILLFFMVVTSCNELNCRYQEKWFPFSWMICSLENMSSVDLVLFINLDFTFKICLSFDIFFLMQSTMYILITVCQGLNQCHNVLVEYLLFKSVNNFLLTYIFQCNLLLEACLLKYRSLKNWL